jgi:hypothetical protein
LITIAAAHAPGEVRVAVRGTDLHDYAIWRPGCPDGVGDLHIGRVAARARALGGSFVVLQGATDGFLPDSEQDTPAGVGTLIAVRVARAAQAGKGPRLAAWLDGGDGIGVVEGPVRLVRRGANPIARFAAVYPQAQIVVDDPALAAALHAEFGARLTVVKRAFDDELEDATAALGAEQVTLPGGGQMRVQPTAALVAIDIDTAGALPATGRKNAAHAGFNASLIPALAREIRLRNLSGAILMDFAGMPARRRASLAAPLGVALAADPVETRLLGFTGLGLAEIVRRRVHPPLHELLAGPHAAAAAALRAAVAQSRPGGGLMLRAAPAVVAALEQDAVMRADLARSPAHALMISSDPQLPACGWRLHAQDPALR